MYGKNDMNRRGFSLVELLVVMAIMGTLLSIATFGFNQYMRKSQMESQTKQLYGDLMEYRAKALYEKKEWTFKINGSSYGIYSSTATGVSPVTTTTLKHPVVTGVTKITFNTRGTTNNLGTVCVEAANDATVDAVVIAQTRVQIGKKNAGADCVAENIVAK